MKTKCIIAGALFSSATLVFAQPASQTGGGAEPGLIHTADFDADGDGKLSDTEKKSADQELKAMAAVREKMMIQKYDADGDGKLSSDEKAAMKKDREVMSGKRDAKALELYDADKDGKLSDAEIAAWQKQRTADRKALVEKYDANKDGVLDETELETAGKASDSTKVAEMVDGQPMRKGSNAPSSSQ